MPRCAILRRLPDSGMSYPAQLHFKENKVLGNIRRIGGIECQKAGLVRKTGKDQCALFYPIIGSRAPFHYRNKSEYPVGRDKNGKLVAGFYAGRTHTIVSGARA